MNKSINIDWFQLNLTGIPQIKKGYTFKKLDYQTRQFRNIIEVTKDNTFICTIANTPLSPILPAKMNLVKFDNKILYRSDFMEIVNNTLRDLKLEFKGISRMDICLDFNYFDCNLCGDTLINNFLRDKYKYTGKSRFKVEGKQYDKITPHYLRFGGNTTEISCYLYNKTKEMNEKAFKQHIFDSWEANNLDITKNIWRLEFSLKGNNIHLLDKSTGELEMINLLSVKYDEFLYNAFFSLVDKYFTFKRFEIYINKEHWKKINLFNIDKSFKSIKILTNSKDYSRSDKIFIKKLESLNCELRGAKFDLAIASQDLTNFFVESRRLYSFYNLKVKQ